MLLLCLFLIGFIGHLNPQIIRECEDDFGLKLISINQTYDNISFTYELTRDNLGFDIYGSEYDFFNIEWKGSNLDPQTDIREFVSAIVTLQNHDLITVTHSIDEPNIPNIKQILNETGWKGKNYLYIEKGDKKCYYEGGINL